MSIEKYKKEYVIRTYEGDKNSNLRLVTLFNIFQDMADEHAENLEVGLSFCLKNGFAWVGSNYHIKINRLPKIHEKIRIETWPAVENRFGAVRDFAVFDADNNLIITASSVWILINYQRRRPIPLRENLPEYTIIPERALNTDFPKLPEVNITTSKIDFVVRYDDIDINNHVNNAVYPVWASEGVNTSFHDEHLIKELEIEFKKEALLGERIAVETFMDTDSDISIHSIKCADDGRELSRTRIKWQEQVKEDA